MHNYLFIAGTILSLLTCSCSSDQNKELNRRKTLSAKDSDTSDTNNTNTDSSTQTDDGYRTVTGFLTSDDLKEPDSLAEIKKADLAKFVNGIAEFYNTEFYKPYPSQKNEDSSKILSCLYALIDEMPVTGTKDSVEIDTEKDVATCLTNLEFSHPTFGKITPEISNAQAHYVVKFICDEGDNLSSFTGKTFKESESTLKDKVCDQRRHLKNIRLTADAKVTMFTLTFNAKVTLISAKMTEQGTACRSRISLNADAMALENTCLEEYKLELDGDGVDALNGEQYVKLTYNELTSVDEDEFYSSGEMEVTINKWIGTMTYSAPTLKPKWDLTNESDTSSGVFNK